MRCWTRNISLLSAALCWVLPVPAPCNANPAHFGAFPNTFIPDLVPGELCPPLTQPLKTLNPLDGSSPDFHTHPAWRGTKSSICALLGGGSDLQHSQPGCCRSRALLASHFPQFSPSRPSLMEPSPSRGGQLSVGTAWLPLCCQRGEWVCRRRGVGYKRTNKELLPEL